MLSAANQSSPLRSEQGFFPLVILRISPSEQNSFGFVFNDLTVQMRLRLEACIYQTKPFVPPPDVIYMGNLL